MLDLIQREARGAPEEVLRVCLSIAPEFNVIEGEIAPVPVGLDGSRQRALSRLAGPGDHHYRGDPEGLLDTRRKDAGKDSRSIHGVNDNHSWRE
jgi:hypothetical protein